MGLLLDLVNTSQRVGATSARLAKVRELAAFLRALPPEEIETAVHYLSGEIPQGRIGIGYSVLKSAVPRRVPRRAGGASRDSLRCAPVAQVRRAAMYSKSLGAVARAALVEGAAALARFQLELFAPIVPMLAQTAADVGEALLELPGEVEFEWKMDGARIQVHKVGDDVRLYTRSLNDVTAAVPEIVATVRGFPEHTLVLDGEAIACDAQGRPHPFQVARVKRYRDDKSVADADSMDSVRRIYAAQ